MLYAPEMLEGILRVLPRMLEAAEAELCLLKVLEVLETLAGLEVLGGDALCAALYTGGRGG